MMAMKVAQRVILTPWLHDQISMVTRLKDMLPFQLFLQILKEILVIGYTSNIRVYTSNSIASPRTFDTNENFQNQLGKFYTPDFYQNLHTPRQTPYEKAARKSYFKQPDSSLPVPKEFPNLFQKYAPGEGKSNFQYAPSQDEVSEELKYAQNPKYGNIGERGEENNYGQNGENAQNTQTEQQISPENDYSNQGNGPDNAAATSNREATWGGDMGVSEGQGSKRSGNPIVFTRDHVGFGPITVEAKTADAPPDDDNLDE